MNIIDIPEIFKIFIFSLEIMVIELRSLQKNMSVSQFSILFSTDVKQNTDASAFLLLKSIMSIGQDSVDIVCNCIVNFNLGLEFDIHTSACLGIIFETDLC